MAVSLRIPPEVKKKVARLAEAQDTTSHAFMLEAIREKVDAEVEATLDEAVTFGRASKFPDASEALDGMYAVNYPGLPARGW